LTTTSIGGKAVASARYPTKLTRRGRLEKLPGGEKTPSNEGKREKKEIRTPSCKEKWAHGKPELKRGKESFEKGSVM